ncbi:MAG TPA: threonine synthase [Pyrinomonadaceae bacterium]|jgi:threonine synthase|nr:threonine synthase [Pyrinomonadaceae bacterium]
MEAPLRAGGTGAATERAWQGCIEATCGARYALHERLYVCPRCGGLLDVLRETKGIGEASALRKVWTERLASMDARDRSGVWRYRELLPFDEDAAIVTLAEGNTPLYDATRAAEYCGLRALRLKHQGCNPTGSFKDTGMTTAVTQARILGARTVVCASTGNTAASLAAYAARAELRCAILVPRGQVSHAKLAQSLDYGATVLELEGNFDDAMRVIRELASDESIYVVNSINPFRLEGQKTVAAELVQQCGWTVPDHLVVPGGNLGNSSALGKGLMELFELGVIDRLPQLWVVQAEGAAPFAQMFTRNVRAASNETTREAGCEASVDNAVIEGVLKPFDSPRTLATAIKIGAPVSWKKALRAVKWMGGRALSVSEQEIADAKAIIGRDGIGCEPASATTVAGIKRLVAGGVIGPDERVVAVLTGHVLKDADYVINYHSGTLSMHDDSASETEDHQGTTEDLRRIAATYANPPVRVRANTAAISEYLKRQEGT